MEQEKVFIAWKDLRFPLSEVEELIPSISRKVYELTQFISFGTFDEFEAKRADILQTLNAEGLKPEDIILDKILSSWDDNLQKYLDRIPPEIGLYDFILAIGLYRAINPEGGYSRLYPPVK